MDKAQTTGKRTISGGIKSDKLDASWSGKGGKKAQDKLNKLAKIMSDFADELDKEEPARG